MVVIGLSQGCQRGIKWLTEGCQNVVRGSSEGCHIVSVKVVIIWQSFHIKVVSTI